MDLLADNGIDFPDTFDEIRFLTPFAVEYRYDFFEDDEPLDRDEMMGLLNELQRWILTRVS